MDKIKIIGGVPLRGKIIISGAKNAALPLMAASILTEEPLTLSNIPHLSDITTMAGLLVHLGISLTVDGMRDNHHNGRVIILRADNIKDTTAPYDIVRKMRASVVVLGPLLARFGHARISLPGGCAIGQRPIDFHINALKKMGAKIELTDGYIDAHSNGKLHGAEIEFPVVSVGATENILMAATLASGITVIKNAASEPEVGDLARCLNAMGANISGIDSNTLIINGVDKLHGAFHRVIADRIEAGTYAIAAAITGGELELVNIREEYLQAVLDKLREVGVKITSTKKGILVKGLKQIKPVDIVTAPYPGFATDMQAQMTALMCLAKGDSSITENIFENRFMHVPELRRMGADIVQEGSSIIKVHGIEKFHGAEVMATDLRASVSLILAALATDEKTTISRVYHIDRGYERIEEKLALCGAKMERIRDKG